MSNLLQRLITAAVAGTASILAIVYSAYGLLVFCFLVSVLGLAEYSRVNQLSKKYRWPLVSLSILIWLGYLAVTWAGFDSDREGLVWQSMLVILPTLSIFLLFNGKEDQPQRSIGIIATGLIYCYLPLILLFKLSYPDAVYDFRIPLGILLLTWVLDVGAYFVGKALGKHPLYPRISPKKTWEGSIGGALLCIGLAVFFEYHVFTSENLQFNWIIIALLISVLSQLGDLVESMYKRSLSLKDSGSILPGHGGILDRFDGTYISIPFIYFYISLISYFQ